jgi:hypothetical protein
MANLIKKVIVLFLLLIAVFAVYMAKNKETREEVLIKLGLAASKDFKIPEDIKIGMDNINMDKIASPVKEEIQEPKEEVQPVAEQEVKTEKSAAPAAQISLDEIASQIEEIGRQVELVQKEVEIMIAMNGIQQQIHDLASQAKELNLECPDCNVLSSS